MSRIDPFRIVIVVAILLVAVFLWSLARNQIVRPFDNLVTEQLCRNHADELGREMIGYERSNRFGLSDRSEGYCLFGDGPNGEAPITVTIEETDPGPLYLGAKWIGIIVQLGIVSLFLRLTIDPALDFYRYLRSAFS
jgi:hypothetical protein